MHAMQQKHSLPRPFGPRKPPNNEVSRVRCNSNYFRWKVGGWLADRSRRRPTEQFADAEVERSECQKSGCDAEGDAALVHEALRRSKAAVDWTSVSKEGFGLTGSHERNDVSEHVREDCWKQRIGLDVVQAENEAKRKD